eukprot:GAHX01001551.1.p1 GENE.GAHX01001551.1~~GAHX01001551.1.p1  ORF type:complete len:287 (-),score=37.67 GAHX01001551.1:433-1293(-)
MKNFLHILFIFEASFIVISNSIGTGYMKCDIVSINQAHNLIIYIYRPSYRIYSGYSSKNTPPYANKTILLLIDLRPNTISTGFDLRAKTSFIRTTGIPGLVHETIETYWAKLYLNYTIPSVYVVYSDALPSEAKGAILNVLQNTSRRKKAQETISEELLKHYNNVKQKNNILVYSLPIIRRQTDTQLYEVPPEQDVNRDITNSFVHFFAEQCPPKDLFGGYISFEISYYVKFLIGKCTAGNVNIKVKTMHSDYNNNWYKMEAGPGAKKISKLYNLLFKVVELSNGL